MKSAIIHISDLHVTLFEKRNGTLNTEVQSYLTNNSDQSASLFFIKTFIDKIKEDFKEFELFLLITGDVADISDELEYTAAIAFVNVIMMDLSIPPSHLLLVPGDHDVSRLLLDIELSKKPDKDIHLQNEIKYSNFASFYKSVKKADFPFDKCIVDHIIVQDRIVLVGCNSNYKINNSGGDGFIEISSLKSELSDLKALLSNSNLEYVLCWHHNIASGFEDSAKGQWEKANRQHLISELLSLNIKLILTGNEHINDSRGIVGEAIMTSDSGMLASTKYQAAFKVYPIYIDQRVALGNHCYSLQKNNGIDHPYFWSHIPSKDWKQPGEYILYVTNTESIDEAIDLPTGDDRTLIIKDSILADQTEQDQSIPLQDSKKAVANRIYYNNSAISQKLYDIIREEKLFHTGHFHWSETSRAHNWIDIPKMLEKSENLYFAQNAIIDVIEQYHLLEECDLIIGLGYEGNIISSKAAIKYGKSYTSLPYSYRYNDHHEYEKRLNYDNSASDYKNIMIITDVVNDGRTIRKLVGKREKDFFKNATKITVISLFYTGHEDIDISILNENHFPANYDVENDHAIDNIEFYTVKTIRVERCPYKKDFREECLIYKDQLSCVHLFYDEDTARKKDEEQALQNSEQSST